MQGYHLYCIFSFNLSTLIINPSFVCNLQSIQNHSFDYSVLSNFWKFFRTQRKDPISLACGSQSASLYLLEFATFGLGEDGHRWCEQSRGGLVSGHGGLICGLNGNWICGFSNYLSYCNAFVAEQWGVFKGLRIAQNRSFMVSDLCIFRSVVLRSLSCGDAVRVEIGP